MLFQIIDDILDVTGTDDELGKPRGSDERHGKRTYVSEYGMERARELAAESHRTARAGARRGGRALRRRPGRSRRRPHERRPSDRRARGDNRLHLHAQLVSLLDKVDGPEDLHLLSEQELAGARAGGARAHHRHGRRDRRPLRREPRHVRAGGRAALAAATRPRTRSSGTSATRPTRTRSSPAGATG